MMNQNQRLSLVPVLGFALLAPVLAGCGSKDSSSTPGSESTPVDSSAAAAATPTAVLTEPLTGLARNSDLVVEVDGQPAPESVIYDQQSPPTFVITAPSLPAPVLVRTREGAVETLDAAKVVPGQDGTLDVQAGAGQKAQGTFSAVGDEVRFTVEGKTVLLKQRPPLLGTKTAADLKAYSPLYERGARAYNPESSAIAALKGLKEPVLVQIYFGSWCAYCKQELPKLVRVEEALAGSPMRFEYYGLPPQFSNEPEAKRLKIGAVPTGIVYVGGREIGRLSNGGWRSPEVGLRDMLAGMATGG